jgi:hypothetical protein
LFLFFEVVSLPCIACILVFCISSSRIGPKHIILSDDWRYTNQFWIGASSPWRRMRPSRARNTSSALAKASQGLLVCKLRKWAIAVLFCPTPHPATSRPTDRPPTNRPTDRPTYRPTDHKEYYELMYDFMYVCFSLGWPHKVIYSNFLALVRIARQAYTWSIAAWIALNALGCCFGSSRVRNSAHEIKCYISNVQYSKYNIQFTTYKYHNLKCSIYFVCSPSRGEFVEILGSSSSCWFRPCLLYTPPVAPSTLAQDSRTKCSSRAIKCSQSAFDCAAPALAKQAREGWKPFWRMYCNMGGGSGAQVNIYIFL